MKQLADFSMYMKRPFAVQKIIYQLKKLKILIYIYNVYTLYVELYGIINTLLTKISNCVGVKLQLNTFGKSRVKYSLQQDGYPIYMSTAIFNYGNWLTKVIYTFPLQKKPAAPAPSSTANTTIRKKPYCELETIVD